MKNFFFRYITAIAVLMSMASTSMFADDITIWEGTAEAGNSQRLELNSNLEAALALTNSSITVSCNAQGWFNLTTSEGWKIQLSQGKYSVENLSLAQKDALRNDPYLILTGGNGASISKVYISGVESNQQENEGSESATPDYEQPQEGDISLFSGNRTIDGWGTEDKRIAIEASKFSSKTIPAGSILTISYSNGGDGKQLKVGYLDNWNLIYPTEAENIVTTNGVNTANFTLTEEIINSLKTRGLIIYGNGGAVVHEVFIIPAVNANISISALPWEGSATLSNRPQNNITISSIPFNGVSNGSTIKIAYTRTDGSNDAFLQTTVNGVIKELDHNIGTIENSQYKLSEDGTLKLTLPQTVLSTIKSKGLVLTGKNITISRISIEEVSANDVDYVSSAIWVGEKQFIGVVNTSIVVSKSFLNSLPKGTISFDITYRTTNGNDGTIVAKCFGCNADDYKKTNSVTKSKDADAITTLTVTPSQLSHIIGDNSTNNAISISGTSNVIVKKIVTKVTYTYVENEHSLLFPLSSWRNSFKIPISTLGTLSAGSKIVLNCAYDGTENNGNEGCMKITCNLDTWHNIGDYFSSTTGYRVENEEALIGGITTGSSNDITFTVSEAFLQHVAQNATKGDGCLYLMGQNLILNNVNIIHPQGNGQTTEGDEIISGNTTIDWGTNTVSIPKSAFDGVLSGSKLHIYYKSSSNDAQIQLYCNNGYDHNNGHTESYGHTLKLGILNPSITYNDTYNVYPVGNGNNHLSLTLDSDVLTKHLQNAYNSDAIIIQGQHVTITNVTIEAANESLRASQTCNSQTWTASNSGQALTWNNLERVYIAKSVFDGVQNGATMTISYKDAANAEIQINCCNCEPWQSQNLTSETTCNATNNAYKPTDGTGTVVVTLNSALLSHIQSHNNITNALALLGNNVTITGISISDNPSSSNNLGGGTQDRTVIWDFTRNDLTIAGENGQMTGFVNDVESDMPSHMLTYKRSADSEDYITNNIAIVNNRYYTCPPSKKGTNCFAFKSMSSLFGLEVLYTDNTQTDPKAYIAETPTGVSIHDLTFSSNASYVYNNFAITPDKTYYLCFQSEVDIKKITLVSSANSIPVFTNNLLNDYIAPSQLSVATQNASIFTWYVSDRNSMANGVVAKVEEGRDSQINESTFNAPQAGKYYFCKVEDKYNAVIAYSNLTHIRSIEEVEAESTKPKVYYEYMPEGIRATIYSHKHDVRYTIDGENPSLSSTAIVQNDNVALERFSTDACLKVSAPAPEGNELYMYSWQLFYHLGTPLETNTEYRLTLKASTTTEGGFDMGFWPTGKYTDNGAEKNNTQYLPGRRVENEWNLCSWTWTTNNVSSLTDLQWAIGGLNGDLYIDNIELVRTSDNKVVFSSTFDTPISSLLLNYPSSEGWWKYSWHEELTAQTYGHSVSTIKASNVNSTKDALTGDLVTAAAPTLGAQEMAYTIAYQDHSHTTHEGILSYDINTSNFVNGGEVETKGLVFSAFRGGIDLTFKVAPSEKVKFTPKKLSFLVNRWNAAEGKIDWTVSVNGEQKGSGSDVVPADLTSDEGWSTIEFDFSSFYNCANEADRLKNGATIKLHINTKNIGTNSFIGLANTTLIGGYFGDDRSNCDLAVSTDKVTVEEKASVSYTTSSSGEITVTSTDPDVARIVLDKVNKKIYVYGVTTGSTIVTVHQADDANYKSKSVSFAAIIENSAFLTNSLYYSFDNDQSPVLSPGTCVNLDYSHTSVISNSTFLNAWIGADINHETIVPLDRENLSNDIWHLDFDWACYGGCNGYNDSYREGYYGSTVLNVVDGTNKVQLFAITDRATYGTTSDLTYHNYTSNADQATSLSIYQCNEGSRASTTTGDKLNTIDYWYHFSLKGSSKGVFLTVYKSNNVNSKVVDNIKIYNKNIVLKNLSITPGNCGSVALDELRLRKEADLTLSATVVAVNGQNRTIKLESSVEGAIIKYNTYSADPSAYFSDYTGQIETNSAHVYAYATFESILKTDVYDFVTGAGVSYKLNAPVINASSYDSENDTYTVNFALNSEDEGLKPSVTYHYRIDGGTESTGNNVTLNAGSTISVYATADGFSASDASTLTAPHAGTKWAIDFTINYVEDGISVVNDNRIDGEYYQLFKDGYTMNANFGVEKIKSDDRFWAHNGALYQQTSGSRYLVFANVKRGQYIRITSTLAMEDAENAEKIENFDGNIQIYCATTDGTIKIHSPRYNNIKKVEILSELYQQKPSATCEGYSVFFDPENDYQAPDNIEVFTAMDMGSYIRLIKVDNGYIPANNGVILKGTTTSAFGLSLEKTWEDPSQAPKLPNNDLEGTSERTLVANLTTQDYVYILGNKKKNGVYQGTAFGLYAKTSYLAAHKVYIDSYVGSQSADVLHFNPMDGDEEENETDIENVNRENSFPDEIFDMEGRLVSNPVSGGMYVHKGHLIIKK